MVFDVVRSPTDLANILRLVLAKDSVVGYRTYNYINQTKASRPFYKLALWFSCLLPSPELRQL